LVSEQNIKFDKDEKIFCVEKMDGMLIIPYWDDATKKWKLSSRGSFEYEVIPIAEKYFNDDYKKFCSDFEGYTPIFEIICQESFIKVQYPDDKYGLYFLGCADTYGNGKGS
jgi:hypothetical protein